MRPILVSCSGASAVVRAGIAAEDAPRSSSRRPRAHILPCILTEGSDPADDVGTRPLPGDIGPAPLAGDVIEMMSSVAEGAALMWGGCGSLVAESSRAAASGTSFWVSGSVLLTRVPSAVLARAV